jgi:hypothetical protein
MSMHSSTNAISRVITKEPTSPSRASSAGVAVDEVDDGHVSVAPSTVTKAPATYSAGWRQSGADRNGGRDLLGRYQRKVIGKKLR